jgi:hypothetical protein
MRHPPGRQLLQEGRLAARRHLARLLTIDPEEESPADGKGQVDQFDFQLFTSLELATSQKSKMIVHDKILYVPTHDTPSTTS